MSREVRRVPVDWQHPTEPNPYWREQTLSQLQRRACLSRLHMPQVRFVPLFAGSISAAQADWDKGAAEWEAGTHSQIAFNLNYHHPEGYLNDDGTRDKPVPLTIYADDGETVLSEVFPTTAGELIANMPFEEYEGSRPTPETHMPDFADDAELGWCLYETVSEGCPVTPVFATAVELIEHLVTVGQDWDQVPMRREAAETLVAQGSSFGSMVVAGGVLYRSDVDADKLDGALGKAVRR